MSEVVKITDVKVIRPYEATERSQERRSQDNRRKIF